MTFRCPHCGARLKHRKHGHAKRRVNLKNGVRPKWDVRPIMPWRGDDSDWRARWRREFGV